MNSTFAREDAIEIAESLRYVGNDLAVDSDGKWISPATEAYKRGWAGWLFVWSGNGYRFKREL
jgi:hypothetical protein